MKYKCQSCSSEVNLNDSYCTSCGSQFLTDATIETVKNLKREFTDKPIEGLVVNQDYRNSSIMQLLPTSKGSKLESIEVYRTGFVYLVFVSGKPKSFKWSTVEDLRYDITLKLNNYG